MLLAHRADERAQAPLLAHQNRAAIYCACKPTLMRWCGISVGRELPYDRVAIWARYTPLSLQPTVSKRL